MPLEALRANIARALLAVAIAPSPLKFSVRLYCAPPSICIMYGCGTAHDTTLFARYCLVTPHQKPPEVGFGAPGGVW